MQCGEGDKKDDNPLFTDSGGLAAGPSWARGDSLLNWVWISEYVTGLDIRIIELRSRLHLNVTLGPSGVSRNVLGST